MIAMSLDLYLASLPQQRRDVFDLLTAKASILAAKRSDIQDFLFVPGVAHPTWEDSANVVWRAIEQLMLVTPAGSDELPIMWIGYDVATRLTNKRDAQGFLITDRRVVVKDSTDLIFGKAEERQYPLYAGPHGIAGSASTIASAAIDSYDWRGAGSLVDEEDAEWFSQTLISVITMTLETLNSTGAELAAAPATASDLRGRVRELGLGSDVKYADDKKQAKHFIKFAKKMPLDPGEQTLASFSDSTLAGVYGLMLTDRNLRSRDLMEDPVCTPKDRVEPAEIRVSPENAHKIIVAAGEVHDVPSHMREHEVAALVTLIREWADSQIN